jgi:neurexin
MGSVCVFVTHIILPTRTESTAYQFGPDNGLIAFTFPVDKRPDTKNDLLALGFLTTDQNAVLVRIESGTSNDYMELELVDGHVLMVYNLGTEDLDIGELSFPVNDGKYHIVRFTRSGQNSTIQVDNHNIMSKAPAGRQLTIFNSHSKVQIGGKKNTVRDAIERPFHGIIAGFVFNGHRILDMAVEGDVKLLMSISNENKNKDRHTGAAGGGQGPDIYENSTRMESAGDPQMQQVFSDHTFES